ARHGHKTSARGFDGYKGHISSDPGSEVIVANDVTAGNVGDGQGAESLIKEATTRPEAEKVEEVYGDACYGTADIVEKLEEVGIEANVKVLAPAPPKKGLFAKSAFDIDLKQQAVRCPQEIAVSIRKRESHDRVGIASFGSHCENCSLKSKCTTSKTGRTIRFHKKEAVLQRSRIRQGTEEWKKKVLLGSSRSGTKNRGPYLTFVSDSPGMTWIADSLSEPPNWRDRRRALTLGSG
ncbi:MAG: transposase, partial [Myxococcales bacterium]|nr:transposase [Myxococcales bacterium]